VTRVAGISASSAIVATRPLKVLAHHGPIIGIKPSSAKSGQIHTNSSIQSKTARAAVTNNSIVIELVSSSSASL
jgi:hypothetical protein